MRYLHKYLAHNCALKPLLKQEFIAGLYNMSTDHLRWVIEYSPVSGDNLKLCTPEERLLALQDKPHLIVSKKCWRYVILGAKTGLVVARDNKTWRSTRLEHFLELFLIGVRRQPGGIMKKATLPTSTARKLWKKKAVSMTIHSKTGVYFIWIQIKRYLSGL